MTRTPEAYLAAIAALDVEHAEKYQPGHLLPGATWCNLFCEDACKALKVPLPGEMLANALHDWLGSPEGKQAGWLELVDVGAASAAAGLGQPTIASWKNPDGGHGHIAMVVPSERFGCHIAQAGRTNYQSAPLNWGFGSYEPTFFTHA